MLKRQIRPQEHAAKHRPEHQIESAEENGANGIGTVEKGTEPQRDQWRYD